MVPSTTQIMLDSYEDINPGEMTFCGKRIDWKTIQSIEKNDQLRVLRLYDCRVRNYPYFFRALKRMKSLRVLKLEGAWVSAHETAAFIQAHTHIKSISLAHCHFADLGAKILAQALYMKEHKALAHFDVSFNDISDQGAVALSKGVVAYGALKTFNIASNRLTSDGVVTCMDQLDTLMEIDYYIGGEQGNLFAEMKCSPREYVQRPRRGTI